MNGCTEYTKATVELYFEKGQEACRFCPLMTTYSRNQCMRTGELIVEPKARGAWCPLNFEEEE